ncbi:MAG: aconitate hydratase AcnA, partial [Anaerolineae bacterium]
LSTVQPSLAGPKRPQDRVGLGEVRASFRKAYPNIQSSTSDTLTHGAVVLAAITSCTNTSNPSVMIGAGLLAKKAVEAGLRTKPWVKTSLAPGSKVVTSYLERAGLMPYLEALGFHVVGYGCTTCIGNSGPLIPEVAAAVREKELVVAAVISGNRNFEGRVHAQVRANYLASPPLVVAYALAGTVDCDLAQEPLGVDGKGRPVYLRDIWPSQEEIRAAIAATLHPDLFREQYADVFTGNELWNGIMAPRGDLFAWDNAHSTYIQEPPFFFDLPLEPAAPADIVGARVLALLGDSITTDHISPAGAIEPNSPAGRYLLERGVPPDEFNQYGARRGNHEVMMRGAFANIRIRNRLTPGVEGGYTVYLGADGAHPASDAGAPGAEILPIYDAAMRYKAAGIPTVVIAGKEYGTGSSRDWAAKGPFLLGVKAVIAESFERIHRSNLVGMGVLPLQFLPGQSAASLGLTGFETYEIRGIAGDALRPKQRLTVRAVAADGAAKTFEVVARVDTPVEVEYYRHGGILQAVLRQMMKA